MQDSCALPGITGAFVGITDMWHLVGAPNIVVLCSALSTPHGIGGCLGGHPPWHFSLFLALGVS